MSSCFGLDPRQEARLLARLIGKKGATVQSLRDLIGVPARTEWLLREFAKAYPVEAGWVESVLRFRAEVAREFERLVE